MTLCAASVRSLPQMCFHICVDVLIRQMLREDFAAQVKVRNWMKRKMLTKVRTATNMFRIFFTSSTNIRCFKGGKPEVIETRKSYRWSDLRTNQINRAPPALSFQLVSRCDSEIDVIVMDIPTTVVVLRWCDSNQGAKRLQKVRGLKFCKNKVFFTADVFQCVP